MNDLFKNITSKNKEKLLMFLEASSLNYNENLSILKTIKNENIIAIVNKGIIEIIKNDYNGNRTIIEELEENDIFGSKISFINNDEYEIITKTNCEIIIIDFDRISNYRGIKNESYNTFLNNLLKIIIKKMDEKNKRIEILTRKTIRNKLLEYFKIESKKTNSKNIYLPFSFTDLADYLAVDRTAMSREMKYLKEEGFITVKQKKITLLY